MKLFLCNFGHISIWFLPCDFIHAHVIIHIFETLDCVNLEVLNFIHA